MDTYEKKYKEALERAREALNDETISSNTIAYLQDIFPELKESEDEKIKRMLIDYFKKYKESEKCGITTFNRIPTDNILSWLEKQGEKKPILDFKAKDWYVSKVDGKIHNIYHSVDKVEPKFKVGDWLVHNERKHIIKVVNPTPLVYEVVNILGYHHTITNTAIENNYHLWTIQDAKDGDVLVVPTINGSEHSEQIFIFKEIKDRDHVKNAVEYYCRYMDNEFVLNEWGFMGQSDDYFIPATKEQRDLLFQKMKEEGYEWDAEKKELKKIENAFNEAYQKLGGFINELSNQFPEVSFAKLSRIAVRVAKWVERNKCNKQNE